MSILDQTVSVLPGVSWRLRGYLAPRARRPIPEPVQDEPAEAEAPVQAPEGESGSEAEDPPAQDVAAVISDGQAEAERGETEDRGSFAEHAGPDAAHLTPDAGYQLPSVSIPAEDEAAEVDAEAGQ